MVRHEWFFSLATDSSLKEKNTYLSISKNGVLNFQYILLKD